MKKIFFLLILLIFPLIVYASDIDYDITNYHIESTILPNGSLNVCEYIGQEGTFNGYEREIDYLSLNEEYAPDDLTNLHIYDYNWKTQTKGQEFDLVSYAQLGSKYKYTIQEKEGYIKVRMYNHAEDEKKGYALCYTLENMTSIHNDIAEIYYNAIPEGMDDVLEDVQIKVYLPGLDEDFRTWVHGPLYGNVSREKTQTNSYMLATIDELDSNTNLEVRIAFNKELVPNSKKTTNKNYFDKILEEEQQFADDANEQRQKAKTINYLQYLIFGINILIIIIILIRAYLKYDKEYKVEFNMEYYRDFPNNYGPETLEYLLKKDITTLGYSASVLNIIDKKALLVEKIPDSKDDYFLKKNPEFNNELTKEEQTIYDFLLNDIGNGNQLTLKSLKKYGTKEKTAKKFINHFNSWQTKSRKTALTYNFYEEKIPGFSIALIIIMTVITSIANYENHIILLIITIFLGIASVVYLASINKRTKEGALEYKKWMAFKKFLVDFGRMDEKELPEVSLWSKYLVYATVLKVANELEKTMKIKLQNIEEYNPNISDVYLTNYLIHSSIYHSIEQGVSKALTVSNATIASSNMSSGSGFGGGFSSGGGGGSIGGGGRGF